MTGQPLYGDPQQPPQQQWQQQPPQQQWQQQPPQQQWQQPQQAYGQQPQGYGQQPQYAQNYGQQPQQFGPGGYPQAGNFNMKSQGMGGRADSDADDDDGSDASGASLRGGVANATVNQSDRLRFIRLTYLHLFGAIAAFAGLLWCYFHIAPLGKLLVPYVNFALGGRWNWGIVLGAFMVVSWVADYWASHATSRPMQYVGLGLYVLAESIIFVPLLVIVQIRTYEIIAKGGHNPNILRDAAICTLAVFAALTASVFFSKKDFSFLRSGLAIASGAALTLIFLSIGFGFNLGIVFSVAMVLLASGYILYQTSQVFAHYHTESYVAAALALFSSVALLFWYIIRIFLRMRE